MQFASATLPIHVLSATSLQSLLHRDRPTLEVNVFPAQPEYFAASHSQRQTGRERCFERVPLNGIQKAPYLFRIGRLDFLTLRPGPVDQASHVSRHEVPVDRLFESASEHEQRQLNGPRA